MGRESVVILNDYEKMKRATNKDAVFDTMDVGDEMPGIKSDDKSADEIIKSIAETGKYMVSNTEVDCSKTLFIITTNEKKEDLIKNFGIDGQKGGGSQRIDIIEFDDLNINDYKQIVAKLVKEVKDELTYYLRDMKLANITIDDTSQEKLAFDLLNDKVNRGRSFNKAKKHILNLFTSHIGEDYGDEYQISYKSTDTPGEIGEFLRTKIDTSIPKDETCVSPLTLFSDDIKGPMFFKNPCVCADCSSVLIKYEDLFEAVNNFDCEHGAEKSSFFSRALSRMTGGLIGKSETYIEFEYKVLRRQYCLGSKIVSPELIYNQKGKDFISEYIASLSKKAFNSEIKQEEFKHFLDKFHKELLAQVYYTKILEEFYKKLEGKKYEGNNYLKVTYDKDLKEPETYIDVNFLKEEAEKIDLDYRTKNNFFELKEYLMILLGIKDEDNK
ncbi:MAG: hypothetical protein RUMPE_00905 [Eubacteriales bacterium SKADARSKE-1]|nr:hypothetical protein [Eubacteriales bacterium SKADARSKE-1]